MTRNDAMHVAKVLSHLEIPRRYKLAVIEEFSRDFDKMFSKSVHKLDRADFELRCSSKTWINHMRALRGKRLI